MLMYAQGTRTSRDRGHFLRASAATIPPAMRPTAPTAEAVMPIPITPSAYI